MASRTRRRQTKSGNKAKSDGDIARTGKLEPGRCSYTHTCRCCLGNRASRARDGSLHTFIDGPRAAAHDAAPSQVGAERRLFHRAPGGGTATSLPASAATWQDTTCRAGILSTALSIISAGDQQYLPI